MFLFSWIISIIVSFQLISPSVHCVPQEDLITHLPGLNDIIHFKHYSGYLNGSLGHHLHYWFVESALNSAEDPIILWMNGGPGCSSLDGLLNELGPYLVSQDGNSLNLNPFSWNKIANVLFLEAPVCVGFSYKDTEGCAISDDKVSLSNYIAIKSFFKKFPEYRKNPLFITGESYAGIYVPTLTVRIVEGNHEFPLNLKGFAVGNGISSFRMNDDSIVFFAYYHGLIGDNLWSKLVSECCDGVGTPQKCRFHSSDHATCSASVATAFKVIFNSGLNMYNLYGKCLHPGLTNATDTSTASRYHIDRGNLFRWNRYKSLRYLNLDPPCTDSTNLRTYLNKEEVQKAVHVRKTNWDICSDEVNANYMTQYKTMKAQYVFLASKGISGLMYNGDVDMACNFLGDEWFADSLGFKEVRGRRMWHFDDQVGGFVKQFKGLDVVTIRGAGHMVPHDKPGQALKMISAFVKGKKY